MRKAIFYVVLTAFFLGIVLAGKGPGVKELILSAKARYEKGDTEEAVKLLEKAIMEIKNHERLTIRNLFICDKISGYQIMKKKPSNTLKHGETLLVYFEPDNFMAKESNGKYLVWLSEDARLLDEKNKVLLEKKDWISFKHEFFSPLAPIFFQNRITGIPKGKYKLEITLNDKLKGSFVTKVLEFTVE